MMFVYLYHNCKLNKHLLLELLDKSKLLNLESCEKCDKLLHDSVKIGDKWIWHGMVHRIDGHAVENLYGVKFWYLYDKIHRENGPAIEYLNGSKKWYKNGKLHRENGPAIIYSNNHKEWWINDYLQKVEYSNGYTTFCK